MAELYIDMLADRHANVGGGIEVVVAPHIIQHATREALKQAIARDGFVVKDPFVLEVEKAALVFEYRGIEIYLVVDEATQGQATGVLKDVGTLVRRVATREQEHRIGVDAETVSLVAVGRGWVFVKQAENAIARGCAPIGGAISSALQRIELLTAIYEVLV